MGALIKNDRNCRRGPDGLRHRPGIGYGRLQGSIYDLSHDRIESGLATINGNLARQVSTGKMTDEERKKALSLITGSSDINDLAPPISSSRPRPRTKASSARSIRRSVRS